METRDDWPPWGRLIDDRREQMGISQNEAARRADMSGTHWRNIVKGVVGAMSTPRGVRTVARMAVVAGVTPNQLAAVAREDVAEALRDLTAPPEREFQVGDDFAERIERILANPAAMRRAAEILKAARIPEVEEDEQRRHRDAG